MMSDISILFAYIYMMLIYIIKIIFDINIL